MKLIKGLKLSREFYLFIFIILIVFAITVFSEGFLNIANIEHILLNVTYIVVAAIGMNLIILTGNIDVSFGSILAVVALAMGNMAVSGISAWIYVPVALVIGTLLGALNGFIVAYGKVPAIITTLGMNQLLRGAILLITGGRWVANLPASFRNIGGGRLFSVPIPIIVTIVVVLAAIWFMKHTPYCRSIYAVGSNRSAAELAGINSKGVILGVYAIAGLLIGISTVIYTTRFTSVQNNVGIGFEMMCISAVVIGGTSITGGSGRIQGTVLGALLAAILTTGLVFLRISTFWMQMVLGALIILAVLSSSMHSKREKETVS